MIRLLDWSETSQVVTVLSGSHGLFRGLAKGSRRLGPSDVARFSGGLEMLTRGEIVADLRPSRDLASITEWDLAEPWTHLRRDAAAHRLGCCAAGLLAAMLPEREPHPACWSAALLFFRELEKRTDRMRELARFQYAVLVETGYRPRLEDTHGAVIDGEAAFDPAAGGLMPLADGGRDAGPGDAPEPGRQVWRVRGRTVQLLRSLEGGEGEKPLAEATAAEWWRVNRLLMAYARHLLGKAPAASEPLLTEKPAGWLIEPGARS